MLKIKDFSVQRGSFTAEIKSLEVNSGECASLCGVSGSGKSTLLEGMGLLTSNFSVGSFLLDNLELKECSDNERQNIRMRYMGIMPQSGGMLPFLTLKENLLLQIKLSWRTQVPEALRLEGDVTDCSSSAIKKRYLEVQELCESLQLGDMLHKIPSELSIGQRQRALFVRALAHKPRLLLIDEPTSALDPENAQKLFDIIESVTKEMQMSVLIVTHDLSSVEHYRHYVFSPKESHAGYSFFKEERRHTKQAHSVGTV